MKIFSLGLILITLTLTTACSQTSDLPKPAAPAQPGAPAPTDQVDNRGADNDFDRAAMGTWITTKCHSNQTGGSLQRMLVIRGHGKISVTDIQYTSADCTGVSQATQPVDITYTIDNYARGGGQITVNGEPQDLTFHDNTLTWSSQSQGTVDYTRANQ